MVFISALSSSCIRRPFRSHKLLYVDNRMYKLMLVFEYYLPVWSQSTNCLVPRSTMLVPNHWHRDKTHVHSTRLSGDIYIDWHSHSSDTYKCWWQLPNPDHRDSAHVFISTCNPIMHESLSWYLFHWIREPSQVIENTRSACRITARRKLARGRQDTCPEEAQFTCVKYTTHINLWKYAPIKVQETNLSDWYGTRQILLSLHRRQLVDGRFGVHQQACGSHEAHRSQVKSMVITSACPAWL